VRNLRWKSFGICSDLGLQLLFGFARKAEDLVFLVCRHIISEHEVGVRIYY
jgi:hypothetical protein